MASSRKVKGKLLTELGANVLVSGQIGSSQGRVVGFVLDIPVLRGFKQGLGQVFRRRRKNLSVLVVDLHDDQASLLGDLHDLIHFHPSVSDRIRHGAADRIKRRRRRKTELEKRGKLLRRKCTRRPARLLV